MLPLTIILLRLLYPWLQRSSRGVYWFHIVCPSVLPSVCGQKRGRSVTSTILVRSISYLHILLSNFRRCVTSKSFYANFTNLKFWQIFQICNFVFVLFWLGIWCESIVWVIIGRRRVLSECRHSSFRNSCRYSWSFLVADKDLFIHHFGCGRPGSGRSWGINSCEIDLVLPNIPISGWYWFKVLKIYYELHSDKNWLPFTDVWDNRNPWT